MSQPLVFGASWPRCTSTFPRVLVPLLLALAAWSLLVTACSADTEGRDGPDAVCFPVSGRAVLICVSGTRVPIGPLSVVEAGDRVVVESGFVVVVDFRQGTRRKILAHGEYVLPEAPHPTQLTMWQRLREALERALRGPDQALVGGAVRKTVRSFWPDSGCFAPSSAIVFRWHGACPTSGTLLVVGSRNDSVAISLGDRLASDGGVPWPSNQKRSPGRVTWKLLDEDGECVGGGSFVILTEAAADSARARYLREAERAFGPAEPALGAALLAAADRQYLW
jgi:hypothetical protein